MKIRVRYITTKKISWCKSEDEPKEGWLLNCSVSEWSSGNNKWAFLIDDDCKIVCIRISKIIKCWEIKSNGKNNKN